eukprot:scaffold2382_cov108-Isochrysis_galbana.AAC.7
MVASVQLEAASAPAIRPIRSASRARAAAASGSAGDGAGAGICRESESEPREAAGQELLLKINVLF